MITPGQKKIVVQTLLKRHPDLMAIYHFGSSAKGKMNRESDIDLAVLAKRHLDTFTTWTLGQHLSALLRYEVDLIDLLKTSTVMRMQVVSKGRCLYEGDTMKRELFEDYVYSAYARLNEERRGIIEDVRNRGKVYG
ncbi:MAG: type VII toxin-antitoxin system MntA family adenylyltransferase antitoxin [bacterium]